MKIVKSVLLASAFCASVFSLSGCSQTANSQPVTSPETAAPTQAGQTTQSVEQWGGKIGQECTIHFVHSVPGPQIGSIISAGGTLKSASDNWVVVSGNGSKGIGKEAVSVNSDYYVPTSNIAYVEFNEEAGKVSKP